MLCRDSGPQGDEDALTGELALWEGAWEGGPWELSETAARSRWIQRGDDVGALGADGVEEQRKKRAWAPPVFLLDPERIPLLRIARRREPNSRYRDGNGCKMLVVMMMMKQTRSSGCGRGNWRRACPTFFRPGKLGRDDWVAFPSPCLPSEMLRNHPVCPPWTYLHGTGCHPRAHTHKIYK